jgi:hypothetical protein
VASASSSSSHRRISRAPAPLSSRHVRSY